MDKQSHAFLKKLLATFKVEAEEHVRALSSGLLELEGASTAEKQADIIERVFREAHSLKGAARAVNIAEIEALCQSLESVFSALKRQALALSPVLFDTLHKAVDTLGQLVLSLEADRAVPEKSRITQIVQALEDTVRSALPPSKQEGLETTPGAAHIRPEPGETPPSQLVVGARASGGEVSIPAETVRISTAKLNTLLLQTEELLPVKLTLGQRVAELREAGTVLASWEKQRAKIHPELRGIQQSLEREGKRNGPVLLLPEPGRTNSSMRKVLEFIDQNDTVTKLLQSKLTTLARLADQDYRLLASMVDALLQDMKKALMLPFSSLLEGFAKLVRDLSRDGGKDVDLVIQGAEVEADKRILEVIKDPLVHLVRNCIDHGIEDPKTREQKKKPPRGTITIAISPKNGDKVEILISDDGAGIDLAKVRASALKLGIVPQEEAEKMTEPGALSLIFQSGVSTSPIVTDISGRGLGLAIVREKVENLGGAVAVETHANAGTTFRILLPLTLAAFRGVLVRVDEHCFVLPTIHVARAVRGSKEEIKTVENRETIQLGGEVISLVRLGDVLRLPRKSAKNGSADKVRVVVLGSSEKRVAFFVDEILNEQEVLVKSLGRQLSRVRNVAGAAVLGTGKVVPVLNVPDLMKSAVKTIAAPSGISAAAEKALPTAKSVLVVEDSITARALLKNILESAGYRVKTAVDGVDAFTTLRTEEFALVVSDVDMPRMNGFELTAKIRADKKLSELPVVLVTALESREDRERGIDVGANAYIVKSSFDQSNLLGVIQRLM